MIINTFQERKKLPAFEVKAKRGTSILTDKSITPLSYIISGDQNIHPMPALNLKFSRSKL